MSIQGEIIPPTLYVYETVELDLSLSEEPSENHLITLHEGIHSRITAHALFASV